MLRTENLRKSYGDKVVLRDIDLVVEPHDVVCLIGSSGSGKSTLLRCLDLLEDIDDGAIHFEGRDISDPRVDARAVRRRMGVVFQSYNLFPHLSVLDNLTLAPRKVHGVDRATAEARAQELLASFGLAEKVHEHPDRLSGGQQQRVAMARAMATDPALLLLDEVTAALDPELTGEVLEIIRRLALDGTTMVLATHEMAFARDVATKVCFLHDGAILEQGTPAEIFENPREERTRQFLRRVLPRAEVSARVEVAQFAAAKHPGTGLIRHRIGEDRSRDRLQPRRPRGPEEEDRPLGDQVGHVRRADQVGRQRRGRLLRRQLGGQAAAGERADRHHPAQVVPSAARQRRPARLPGARLAGDGYNEVGQGYYIYEVDPWTDIYEPWIDRIENAFKGWESIPEPGDFSGPIESIRAAVTALTPLPDRGRRRQPRGRVRHDVRRRRARVRRSAPWTPSSAAARRGPTRAC